MATNTRNHCDLCNQDFDTPDELKQHKARQHSPEGMQAESRDRSQQGSMGETNRNPRKE